VGTESGEMCVNYFTLRTFIILMETIKNLFKRLASELQFFGQPM
jgi:hypothetical protein